MIVIGETLFRFERESDGNRTVICASKNYGVKWYVHSEVPHNILRFETLTVNTKSGVHVYLFGFCRYNAPNNYHYIAEVWVSTDLMKTFELVTEDTAFRSFELTASCVRSDGSFLIIGCSDLVECRWTSDDCGKTWQNLYRHDFPDLRELILERIIRGSIVSYDNRLFAVKATYSGGAGKLIISENGGLTWTLADVPFLAQAIVKDPRFNRLICFSYNESYELCSGGTAFKRMDLKWECDEPDSFLDKVFVYTLIDPFMFASGSICLQVIHVARGFCSVTRILVSRPLRDVLEDKMILAMLFARFGIHAALFTTFIAPFIFPF